MQAAYYVEHGGPEKLQIGERPKPEPGPGEVVVRIHAAAVGAWDVHVMAGMFGSPSLPMIPSCEIAGVVQAAGDGSDLLPGEQVYGCLGFASGGLAEYATVKSDRLARKPDTVSFEQAAALVVAAGTAYEGLADRARLKSGETVLVTAASGGVGSAAVQIAAASGATVLGVASARNHDRVRSLGASAVFDYNDVDWIRRLSESLPGRVDVLFDGAGGTTRDQAVSAVRRHGRAVFIMGAPPSLRPDIEDHVFSADITRARLESINRLVAEGKLAADVDVELPLERAPEALALVAAGRSRGRVVVRVNDSDGELAAARIRKHPHDEEAA
jgi:NADPH2:quinone reductase